MIQVAADAGARWIILTPSVDDAGWREAISVGATAAGLRVVNFSEDLSPSDLTDNSLVIVCDDAERALAANGRNIVAIIPEPETCPEAVAETYGIAAPDDVWHASLLLARAAALAPIHSVVTASDLARRPTLLRFFGEIDVHPPASVAEVSRNPAVASAFAVFRDKRLSLDADVSWSANLFVYDVRAARNWPSTGVLDTTGRPRILAQGPYIALPPGHWKARIRFAVDADAARREYRIDWGTRTACKSEHVRPNGAGIYEIELDFQWEEPSAAEIRIILVEGSFSGNLMFYGNTVRQHLGPPSAAITADDEALVAI